MNLDEPSFTDPAGEMHAAIVRREAADHRRTVRRLAQNLDQRRWEHARIAEYLDMSLQQLGRILAVDGRSVCTDCVFEMHHHCLGVMQHPSGAVADCECTECHYPAPS